MAGNLKNCKECNCRVCKKGSGILHHFIVNYDALNYSQNLYQLMYTFKGGKGRIGKGKAKVVRVGRMAGGGMMEEGGGKRGQFGGNTEKVGERGGQVCGNYGVSHIISQSRKQVDKILCT